MQIVRYGPAGEEQPGLVFADGVLPLTSVGGGRSIEQLLPDWADVEREVPALLRSVAKLDLANLRLAPPLGRPPKIVGVGANYRSAPDEAARGPVDPILFLKPASSLVGPTDTVVLPFEAGVVVAETELAIVIARPAHRLSAEEAMDYVFGYTIANDITAPDVMLGDSHQSPLFFQQGRGKGFPTFCPLGPWIVPAAQIPEATGLGIVQEIDGSVDLAGPTSLMIHSVAVLVSEVSHAFGLEAGDVILSGSPRPAGGAPRRALVSGNTLISRIDGLGCMINPVVREEDCWPGQPIRRWSAKAADY